MRLLYASDLYAVLPAGLGVGQQARELPLYERPRALVGPRPDRNGVYTVGGEVTTPALMYSEAVVYTDRMRELDAQGIVMVTAVLGIDGVPYGPDVLVPLSPTFDAAALKAAGQLRFEPATLRSAPVPVRIFVEFKFTGSHSPVAPAIVQRGNPMVPPVALNSVWAAYPRKARDKRIRGTVAVSFVVNTEGLPVQLRLVRRVTDELDQSALRAVERLRFKPAMMDGIPVRAHVTIEVHFHLYF